MSKSPRHRLTVPLLATLLGLSVLMLACRSIASPDGWASPVIDGDLFLAAHEDELFALDSADFQPLWAFPSMAVETAADDDVDAVALYGTPAIADDRVLVPAYDKYVYALERESGDLLWRFKTDSALIGGIVASETTAYVGSDDGTVYALELDNGRPSWQFEASDSVWSTPALAGDTLYVTSLDSGLYALDAETGAELWRFDTGAGIGGPPVVSEDGSVVVIGGFDNELRGIDTETQEERWSVKADNWFWTAPIIVDGTVYAGSLDETVYAVDLASGDLVWSEPFPTEALVRSAPLFVDDVLVIVDNDGNVYGIEAGSGSEARGTLVLDEEVFADPVFVESEEDGTQIVIVTSGGEVIRLDAESFEVLGRRPLTN